MPLPSTVISGFYSTMDTRISVTHLISFLVLSIVRHTSNWGDNRTSAITITYFLSTSPSSQTGGYLHTLTITVMRMLSAVIKNTSTISNLIIIAQLNQFTFVSALLPPCPTLKSNVTMSSPRTRYRWLVITYSTSFSCYILSAYQSFAEFLPLASGKSAMLISQLAPM